MNFIIYLIFAENKITLSSITFHIQKTSAYRLVLHQVLYLQIFLSSAISNNITNIVFWFRYIDNILVTFGILSRQVNHQVNFINWLHDKIKFTVEIERNLHLTRTPEQLAIDIIGVCFGLTVATFISKDRFRFLQVNFIVGALTS